MFQTIADFERNWNYERDATAKVFKALTDASLAQAVSPQDRTIGRIAWHMAQTHPEMLAHTGLTIDGPAVEAPVPDAAAEIVAGYERGSASVLEQV
ncbi:MAG TPA: DinB family protein [Acidobacteriota bacterium]|nr:DinB family protein [Acidobacteriota bacterium]